MVQRIFPGINVTNYKASNLGWDHVGVNGMSQKSATSGIGAIMNQHRGLFKEYQDVKKKVKAYQKQRFLTPGESVEQRTLQRLKLYKKDQLQRLESKMAEMGLVPEKK